MEYDLHSQLGLDILDWFEARKPWGKLLRLANQLPEHSRFKAAMYDDDEAVASLGDELLKDPSGKAGSVPLQHYDPILARLTDIGDLLISLRQTLIAVNSDGKKPPKAEFLPRPETAIDRARRRASRARIADLRNVLTPGR